MLDALDRELSWMADRHDTLAKVDESAALSDTPGEPAGEAGSTGEHV
jgi:hypothetical protein